MEEDLAERWQPGKAYDEVEIAEALAEAKKAHRRTTRQAATVGSLAHDWISQCIAGEEPELPVNQSVLQAVKAFLGWVEANQSEVPPDRAQGVQPQARLRRHIGLRGPGQW